MRFGVVCRVTDNSLYNITYKNHKLYCHRNSIKYSILTPNLLQEPFIKHIDYILYINEHHRFLQIDNHISNIIHSTSNLLYSKIEGSIDNNLAIISTNAIGQRIIKQLYKNNLQELLSIYDIDNSKACEHLPHLFKLSIEKYTQYVGIRSKVFMIDTNNIDLETSKLLHKSLNIELGIK